MLSFLFLVSLYLFFLTFLYILEMAEKDFGLAVSMSVRF